MSSKVVIGALLVATVLGVAAYLTIRPGAGGGGGAAGRLEAGAPLFALRPSRVVSVLIEPGDGRVQRLESSGGRWMLRLGVDGEIDVSAPAWPVEDVRVRSLLRFLSELRSSGAPDEGASIGSGAMRLTLKLDDGPTMVLSLASRRLGGFVLARTESGGEARVALIADDLVDALTPGPPSWRETGAMGSAMSDPSRVSMESERGTVGFGRVNRAWRILRPVRAPADPVAVERLLRAVGQVRITDFLDDGVPSGETGLDSPLATVTLQSDARVPDPENPDEVVRVETTGRLVLGAPANSAGTRLYAMTPLADHVVVVDPTPLTALKVAPEPYIRGACVGVRPEDVGSVTVASDGAAWRAYRRTMKGWGEAGVDDETSAVSLLDSESAGRVDGMTGFLASAVPSRISLDPPEGFESSVSVELGTLDASPLESVEVGVVADGGIVVKSGAVYRVFAGDAVSELLLGLVAEGVVRAAGAGGGGVGGVPVDVDVQK